MESLRHSQAKVTELERSNKKLNEKLHGNMREMIKLKEEIQGYKSKVYSSKCIILYDNDILYRLVD